MKRPVKITLKKTGANYMVIQIANAITVEVSDPQRPNEHYTIRVGNTLIEREAEELVNRYPVTVK